MAKAIKKAPVVEKQEIVWKNETAQKIEVVIASVAVSILPGCTITLPSTVYIAPTTRLTRV